MKRLARYAILALGVTVAAPLAAGPIYLPIALNEPDGAYVRTTDLWVTNPDSAVQGFVVRFLESFSDGTARAAGDELGPFYLAPGESRRYTNIVPQGFRGMLEFDGGGMLLFNAALTTRNVAGSKVSEAELPVLTQVNLGAANSSLSLQGWERTGSTLTTNLGIVNAGHAAARCVISIRQRDALLVIQNVGVNLQPLSMVQFDDALALLGLSVVAEGARSEITCNQPFWTYISTYNDQTGATELIEPSTTIGQSTLLEPAPGPGPGPGPGPEPNAFVIRRDGEFLNCASHCDHFRINLAPPDSYRKIVLDFDVHVGQWDSNKPNGFHNVLWIQNGSSWSNLIGYLNARGNKNKMTFEVKSYTNQNRDQGPGMQTNTDYHVTYYYDLIEHVVGYEIRTTGGSLRVRGEYGISNSVSSINPSGLFAAFGAQLAPIGPEARTRGWRFSNMVAQFIP